MRNSLDRLHQKSATASKKKFQIFDYYARSYSRIFEIFFLWMLLVFDCSQYANSIQIICILSAYLHNIAIHAIYNQDWLLKYWIICEILLIGCIKNQQQLQKKISNIRLFCKKLYSCYHFFYFQKSIFQVWYLLFLLTHINIFIKFKIWE